MRVQMLGLCRFSYLGMRGYQVEHDSIAARRAYLYESARMERRWQWFTTVALPGWLAQTDPDFTLVVMTGPDLPQPCLDHLQGLCERVPQMRLSLVPPMEYHLQACRAAVAPHVDPAADVIGHFRHDDDDAVALDYVAEARADFARVSALWQAEGRLSLDYGRGFMVEARDGQLKITPRICHNMGVALTIFLRPDAEETALHFNHTKLAQWMPGVQVNRQPMFLRSIHADSDSGDMGPGLPWQPEDGTLNLILRQRFGLRRGDLADLARRLEAGGAGGAC
ncbi:glycosyltransferase [Paracoccus rhizosphaerae]|uniref:Glycosyltransferase n=1 Tax=Paracoccus rhizosphaerae TaxID=1133347 RepID=A0ABV6CQB9_9RHOB|nr:glycosyltransferase [Paracoccus rhizosphaerae]